MASSSVSDRLLDAQVAWLVNRLTGPDLHDVIASDVDDLLQAASGMRLDELVSADAVKTVARSLFTVVPPSGGATALVEMAAGVAFEGPEESFALSDVIDRENVERLADEVLGMTDLAEQLLDELTRSPLVASLSSRFVARLINDVMAANRAVAERIPGMGSLVALGSSVAGRAIGAADKQLEALLGDTAGKGAAFAMRRLNKVLLDTLRDPTARAAVLEVYDLYADQPVTALSQIATEDDVQRVAALLHDIVVAAAPTEPVMALVDALIDGFFSLYGERPVSVLLEELDLSRDVLVEHAQAIVPGVLKGAQESGELDRLLRARLTPFFDSPEVAAILG